MSHEPPPARAAYNLMARAFAEKIDTAPYNAYYERPATLSLLPDVAGLRVLDLGCGPGWYAAWLLDRGAEVVGIDASPLMLEFARERTGGHGTFHLADFGQPLSMCAAASFDLVLSALALGHAPDLDTVFGEVARVLKPRGTFVFSMEHPFARFMQSPTGDYFAREWLELWWNAIPDNPTPVPVFRRPLSAITGPLLAQGFVLERLREPRPVPEFEQVHPEGYARAQHNPLFICFRARRGE